VNGKYKCLNGKKHVKGKCIKNKTCERWKIVKGRSICPRGKKPINGNCKKNKICKGGKNN
jgi:hypothetical protein